MDYSDSDMYILWDHENCHVPNLFASYNLIESQIENAIRQLGYLGRIRLVCVVGHLSRMNPWVKSNFSNNVRVIAVHSDLSKVTKQAADHETVSRLKSWLLQRKKEIGVVVIISSDNDMCPNVDKVKNHGSAIVIIANNDCSKGLREAVDDIYSWQSVLDSENPVKKLEKEKEQTK